MVPGRSDRILTPLRGLNESTSYLAAVRGLPYQPVTRYYRRRSGIGPFRIPRAGNWLRNVPRSISAPHRVHEQGNPL